MILISDKKRCIYDANDLLIIPYRAFLTVYRTQAKLGIPENDQQRPTSAQREDEGAVQSNTKERWKWGNLMLLRILHKYE